MANDEMVRTTLLVPEHVKEAAKRNTERGEISTELRRTYRKLAFGEAVEREDTERQRLQELREEKDDIRSKIRNLQADLEELEREEARLEERLQNRESREQKYETILETLESELYDGANITVHRSSVKNAADLKEVTPKEVVEEIKERNPAVPDHAFKPPMETNEEWNGIDLSD